MRVDLVEAGLVPEGGGSSAWTSWLDPAGRFFCPPLGLYRLAAAAPEVELRVWDEKVSGPYTPAIDVDLVGISCKTMSAYRAYSLADGLRAAGIRVVLGGVHATFCPREGDDYVDAVVGGEAERVWPRLLEDLEAGRLQRVYVSERRPNLGALPPLRTDLIDHRLYIFHALEASRGCALDCPDCPSRSFVGEGYRLRRVATVVEELTALLRAADKPVFFTDEVFGAGHATYLDELLPRLAQSGARFIASGDPKILSPRRIQGLARAGCTALNLTLGRWGEDEEAAIHGLRGAGIEVWAHFVFGLDHQRQDVFRSCVELVGRTGIEAVTLSVAAPDGNTPRAAQLESEGRVLTRDWRFYDRAHVVTVPSWMSAQQLDEGLRFVASEIGALELSRRWSGGAG